MELKDIYNKDREKIKSPTPRKQPLNKGEYRLVVHVCLFNNKNQMLIQQRQSKQLFANCWDFSVAGGVVAGETSSIAGEREVKEELGIDISLKNERAYFTINFDSGFDDYFLVEKEIDINQLVLQEEEVKQAKWATKQEILDMIENKQFINYHPSLVELMFDIRKNRGSFKE